MYETVKSGNNNKNEGKSHHKSYRMFIIHHSNFIFLGKVKSQVERNADLSHVKHMSNKTPAVLSKSRHLVQSSDVDPM